MGRFSAVMMDHFSAPCNAGTLDAPDRVGCAGTPGQGPYLALHLRLAGETIVAAKFQTYGCGVSIATGSMLTVMMIGKSIHECLALTADDLAEALGGFPPDKAHCPILAIAAVRDALAGGGG